MSPLVNLSARPYFRALVSLLIPLTLSSFTFLWNPLGFPAGTSYDEGIYLRRAMHVLNGHGPQENPWFYDHPYFSQLFIAAYLWSIGYPASVNPSSEDINSIKGLFLLPKLLVGMLAILDTFLIYLITQHRYNRRVAFGAAMLFASMPLTVILLRRVWLEPIQLPFILSSILFALWMQRSSSSNHDNKTSTRYGTQGNQSNHRNNNNSMRSAVPMYFNKIMGRINASRSAAILFATISGAFLGIAIFTKVPSFTFIPLIGFLVYINSRRKKRKRLPFLWFVTLLGIAMLWPLYAFSVGHITEWAEGILQQTNREGRDLFYTLQYDLAIDPVLLILGGTGVIYAIFRKDLFILLWIIPFLVFLYFIGFVSFWHVIPVLPAFCIAIATMIDEISRRIAKRALLKDIIPVLAILSIVSVEIAYIAPLINQGSNENHFLAMTFLIDYLGRETNKTEEEPLQFKEEKFTVIGDPSYLWIPQYVFNLDNFDYKTYSGDPLDSSNRALIIADQGLMQVLSIDNETSRVLDQMVYSPNNNTKMIMTFGDAYAQSREVSILLYDPLFSPNHSSKLLGE